MLRLFSLFDVAVGSYLRPFWSDHKANALRSVTQLVNEVSNKDNMVAQHPEQFVLYEIATFDEQSGELVSISMPLCKCIELVVKAA